MKNEIEMFEALLNVTFLKMLLYVACICLIIIGLDMRRALNGKVMVWRDKYGHIDGFLTIRGDEQIRERRWEFVERNMGFG